MTRTAGDTTSALVVSYTVTGTATSGTDYVALTGSVTIPAGSTTGTITVTPVDDGTDEPTETVVVTLSSPGDGSYTVGSASSATVSIEDDDPAPTVAFIVAASSGPESATPANLAVSLSAASGQIVTVDYAVTGGTATGGGVDYTLASGTLTFAPGETSKNIAVVVVDDTLDEPNETVEVTLSNATHATLGATTVHTYTIQDNDAAPTVSLGLTGSPMPEAGTTSATVTATLSAVSGQDVTVNLAFSGTATLASDYTRTAPAGTTFTCSSASSCALTIPAGSTARSFTLTAVQDTVYEGDETVVIDVDSVTNGTESGTQQVTAVITDDDPVPTSTTVSCTETVAVGDSATCTATVADTNAGSTSTPSGTVTFTLTADVDGDAGAFTPAASCTLGASGSCSVTYTPSAVGDGTHTINAAYSGDATHQASGGSDEVTVTKRSTTTAVDCAPNPVETNSPTTCTATVQDIDTAGTATSPMGTVTFSSSQGGTFTPSSCTLTPVLGATPPSSSCWVTYSQSSAGIPTITASYAGNAVHGASSGTFLLVVYDPNGGFVTGGGWFTSPRGAYTAAPDAFGRANFGFVSKYQKGAKVPTGQTQFRFQAGNLEFHSTSYEWLVVSGAGAGPNPNAKAQYKGWGVINRDTTVTYEFILTATDGQYGGATGTDKLRLKICTPTCDDVAGTVVVYDNQRLAPNSSDPVTAVQGSIVIHNK